MATYYVHKGVGSDSNNGLSWTNAFASLGKAYAVSGNNDTVRVRAGATPYYEKVALQKSGQLWVADDGHTPVIDGKYHDGLTDLLLWNKPPGTYVVQTEDTGAGPGGHPNLVTVGGSDNELRGFKICNSAGSCVGMGGQRNILRQCRVDFAYGSCIIINGTSNRDTCVDHLVEDCVSSRGSIKRWCYTDWLKWGGKPTSAGVVVCNAMKNCGRCTFRRVTSHHQNGESLVIAKGAWSCTLDSCVSYNNHHMNIYVNNAQDPIVKFCFSWSNGQEEMLRKGSIPTEPIVIGDEAHGASQSENSVNQRIYGNIFVGGRDVLDGRSGDTYVTRLKGAYIGYNTFVALPGVTTTILSISPAAPGNIANSIFENNVIYAPGVTRLASSDSVPGLQARNNVIYKPSGVSVPAWLNGPGTVVADPKLVNGLAQIIDNSGVFDLPVDGGNNADANNYKLTGSSPAVGAAITTYPFNGHNGVPEAQQRDYFGASRADPDIGAHEFGGTVTPTVTAAFTRNPVATSLDTGTAVTFTNASFTTGTASITGQTWTVRKAGIVQATATTTNYNYTFATEGNYTVELAVTASGGLSDTETLAYTITDGGGGVVVTAAFSAAPPQTTLTKGSTVQFTGQSTVQNGTLASQAWAVLALPGLSQVGSGTGATFGYAFATAGSFRVRLTATATTGETDTETLDYTINDSTTPTVTADFTMSDGDGVIQAGGSITFTNTSTATNTTITGYTWEVKRTGSTTGHNYTTTNITHVFAQEGTYTVSMTVATAAGISDTKTGTVTVLAGVTTGMDFMVVPVSFAVNTSTGAQTVTADALGAKIPKGVHVRLVGATVAGTAANGALYSDGAGSDTAQWVHVRHSANGAGTTAAWRRWATDAIIMTLDDSGAVSGRASLVKFVAGGMELNISDAFPAGYRAEAIFYAGDVCEFWAGSTVVGTVDTDTPVNTGINQAAVYMTTTWAQQENVTDIDAETSRGWAVPPEPDNPEAVAQFHFRNEDQGGRDTSAVFGRWQQRIGSANEAPGGYCTIEANGFHVGGFNLRPYNSSLARTASMYAFGTGGYRVSLQSVQLSTGASSFHGFDFEAQTALALTGTFTGDAYTSLGGTQPETMGWLTVSAHGPTTISGNIAASNGAATSSTRSYLATAARAVGPSSADLWNGAAALDAAGLTVTWTAAPAAAYRMILLGIEVGTIQGTTDDPVADFLVELDPNVRSGRAAAWFSSAPSNGNGEDISGYLWDFGDGTTSDEANPMHVYEQPGEYTVSLTVTTAAGTNTKTVEALVLVAMVGGVADIVGPSRPQTSGGVTGNDTDENGDHRHAVRFDNWAHFRAMSDGEATLFATMLPDAEYVLVAYDTANHRFIVKEPDGTHRYIATTS